MSRAWWVSGRMYSHKRMVMTEMGLSASAQDKILRINRTVADLDPSPSLRSHHLSEAINHHTLDFSFWTRRRVRVYWTHPLFQTREVGPIGRVVPCRLDLTQMPRETSIRPAVRVGLSALLGED